MKGRYKSDKTENIGGVIVERDISCRMRDGTLLFSDIYYPESEDVYPVLLLRQPYDKTHALTFAYKHPSWYARKGYIVVSQDVRGRWRSEGEFEPFIHETNDSYDSVEWAAGLACSNGRVGMYGYSYGGMTQIYAAISQPPHLTCICPAFTPSQCYDGFIYRGGALSLAFVISWSLCLARDTARRKVRFDLEAELDSKLSSGKNIFNMLPVSNVPILRATGLAPYFIDWLNHPSYDEYWKKLSIFENYDKIRVPCLHIGGFYDACLEGTVKNFQGIRECSLDKTTQENQRLILGPWYHNPWVPATGIENFGSEARNCVDNAQIRWFDKWLKGIDDTKIDESAVQYFISGEKSWHSAPVWPPRQSNPVQYFLHSDGTAHTRWGSGYLDETKPLIEPADVYVYDPRSPVPSEGGHSCCMPVLTPMGPADQRAIEDIMQVLVYKSPLLTKHLVIAGPVKVIVWASINTPDSDITVKLVDSNPSGCAINIGEGILRSCYRESFDKRVKTEPGVIYKYEIECGNAAHRFNVGHQVLLEISSSNFPHWERNTNSGNIPALDGYKDLRVATVQVFHTSVFPSVLILPVIDR